MDRLHKYLAHSGIASRRDCEDLIRQGRVTVDGRSVTELGEVVDPDKQTIKVDGVRVKRREPVYFLLNKPEGVVCTTSTEERLPKAIDYAPKGAGPLHTVGRLDKDTEGLVILTNDGDLTERLTHPKNEVPKIYRVLARGKVGVESIAKMKKGIWLAEGRARATSVRILQVTRTGTLLEVELREGMNREIRRMLARLGHPVRSLTRTAVGPLKIAGLARGKVRVITREEVEALIRALDAPPPKKPRPARPKKDGADPKPSKDGKVAGARKSGAARPAAATPSARRPAEPRPPRLPPPPPEPGAPRPRYEPDEDGVIVVRRPPVRDDPGEEE